MSRPHLKGTKKLIHTGDKFSQVHSLCILVTASYDEIKVICILVTSLCVKNSLHTDGKLLYGSAQHLCILVICFILANNEKW